MKYLFLVCSFLLISSSVFAQETFEITDASKKYNVRLQVAKCDETFCSGDAKFSIFRKGEKEPFQIFTTQTEFMSVEAKMSNTKKMYDYQSVVFFDDVNFDGIEDLSIRDGNGGGYGGPSYQIYLFSPKAQKFVHNEAFTALNQEQNLGAMTVDKKKKVLRVFGKSGCCWHIMEEYKVFNNRPVKVFVEEEDATMSDEKNADKVKITTKRLVKGKWQTKVKYVKRVE